MNEYRIYQKKAKTQAAKKLWGFMATVEEKPIIGIGLSCLAGLGIAILMHIA